MTRKKISMNVSRSTPVIMERKIATGASMNARKQIDNKLLQFPTPKLSRALKNVKE
jgi:hypothetical protein